MHSTLTALRAFFIWLAGQPGYKRRIAYSDADYFNLSEKDVRIAKASREKPVPSLDQVHHVLASMPAGTDIEMRNRALIAFAVLTGARGAALASLKLKHVDLKQGSIFQDARDVRTKGSKTFTTWFCPVGGDPRHPAFDVRTAVIEFAVRGRNLLTAARVGLGLTYRAVRSRCLARMVSVPSVLCGAV